MYINSTIIIKYKKTTTRIVNISIFSAIELQRILCFLIRSLFRHVRQTNDNCVSQQIATTSVLNCGCSCVGVCLRRRVDQLNLLLRTIRIPITFPDRTTTSVIIVGVGIFIREFFF